jgi:hypothetical protein
MIEALEPFAEGALELASGDLEGVDDELRRQVVTPLPPSRSRPERFDVTRTTVGIVRDAPHGKDLTRRIAALALGSAAVVAVVVAAARFGSTRAPSTESARTEAVLPAPSGTAQTISARVEVIPPEASVSVDGVVRPVTGGAVVLEGAVGQTFDVSASASGQETRQRVVLSSDGQAIPGRIELALQSTDVANKSKAVASGARAAKRAPEPKTAATATSAAEPALPTATHGTPEPTFKDTW